MKLSPFEGLGSALWLKWATGIAVYASLTAGAFMLGNRQLLIAACGLPAIIGSAVLAVTYGQRHGYG